MQRVYKETSRKSYLLASYKRLLSEHKVVLALQNSVLLRDEDRKLRSELTAAGAKFTITRSALMRVALRQMPELSPALEPLSEVFTGSTAVVALKELDPKQLNKIVAILDKQEPKLVLLAAALDNKAIFRNGIDTLKSLPPLPQLQSELAGILNMAGGGALVSALQTPAQSLVTNLSNIEK